MKFLVKLFGKNFLVSQRIEGIEKELPKGMNIDDYYTMNVLCANCKQEMSIYIKKGVHLNDIVTGVRCSNCEVHLEKQEK
jgi:hypothetical protein